MSLTPQSTHHGTIPFTEPRPLRSGSGGNRFPPTTLTQPPSPALLKQGQGKSISARQGEPPFDPAEHQRKQDRQGSHEPAADPAEHKYDQLDPNETGEKAPDIRYPQTERNNP